LVEGFPMGFVGQSEGDDDDNNGEWLSAEAFIPKQVTPDEDLKNKVKVSKEAGRRKITSVIDVMEDDEKLLMVIDDILPDTGLMYVAGASGTGKTILAIQLVGNIINGEPTMSWRLGPAVTPDFKALFLSLEMPKKELQLRLNHMYPKLSEEKRKEFLSRFLCYSEYETFELWNPVHQLDLVRIIKDYEPNMILIDSASVSFATSLKNDEQVNTSIQFLYMLRSRFNLSMVIVCHTRKPSIEMVNSPETASLHELFGHSGVAQSASAIIIMLEDEKQRKATIKSGDGTKVEKMVHIVNAKARFGSNSGAFASYLTSKEDVDKGTPLMFRRNAIPIAMTTEQRKKLNNLPGTDLKDAMAEIDFGLLGDDDE
jgi:hypothetical protein